MNKIQELKKYFGYDSFRQGQEELIDNILNGTDTLGIMPTGAGKSICFQLPALMLEGITIVISPLISLMKDQVNSLNQAGINAAFLNSTLTNSQYIKALQNITENKYKIVYVAPERLQTEEFVSLTKKINISMVTIDEAHCVSQWGQDFRPSYVKISQFINELTERPVISAFTATATSKVKEDIIEKLELNSPYTLITGFDRENLHFAVRKPKDKLSELKQFLRQKEDNYGIVYCSTRKNVEEVCSKLISSGFNSTRYHAGLSEQERRENQEAFIYDKYNVMVATNAFGMGIDKSNVSYVVHFNMPKNIESYYQEAGRAGRDGENAECLLLYSPQDVVMNQFLIDKADENEELDKETLMLIKQKDHELLKKMTFYCHTNDCLREYILEYFGEKPINYCGNCSNCNSNFEEADVTIEAQKIFSCIKKSGERFGTKMIVDILRGSKNQKLLNYKLNNLSTYGLMSDTPENKVRDIINFLALNNYVKITNDEYPVIKLANEANKVLFENKILKMKVLKHYDEPKAKVSTGKIKSDIINQELFERLRTLRSQIASRERVPAFVVFSDATLKDMCKKLPRNENEFLEVSGVGQTKLKRYGEAFLNEIRLKHE